MAAEIWSRRSLLGAGGAACVLLAGCGRGNSGRPRLRVSITGKGEGDTRLLFKAAGIEQAEFKGGV
ncbi:hypothetical protein [Sphingobium sp. EM0848]|uniref:hypothetical protein n=1 Tax=Sphingobium sp. EM0848 TaxID=2743473 RepID=UPI00159C651B|nr:hypothetical protein [Sphingobium sp. EM0848]